jgi:hypothetical protein
MERHNIVPESKKVSTTLTPGLYRLLQDRARRDLTGPSTVLRQALAKYLDYDPRIDEQDQDAGAPDTIRERRQQPEGNRSPWRFGRGSSQRS